MLSSVMSKKPKKVNDEFDKLIEGALKKTEIDKKAKRRKKRKKKRVLMKKIKEALSKKKEEKSDSDESFGFEDEGQMFEEGGMFFLGARNQSLRQSGGIERVGSLEDLPSARTSENDDSGPVKYDILKGANGIKYEFGEGVSKYEISKEPIGTYKEFMPQKSIYEVGTKKEDKSIREVGFGDEKNKDKPSQLEETIDKESKEMRKRYSY